jgi:hypothetical protein
LNKRSKKEVGNFIEELIPLVQLNFDLMGAVPLLTIIENVKNERIVISVLPEDMNRLKLEFSVAIVILARMLGDVKSITTFLEMWMSKVPEKIVKEYMERFNGDKVKVASHIEKIQSEYKKEAIMVMYDGFEEHYIVQLDIDRTCDKPKAFSLDEFDAHIQEQTPDFNIRFNSLFYKTSVIDTILNKVSVQFPKMTDEEMVVRFTKILAPSANTQAAYNMAKQFHAQIQGGTTKIKAQIPS